MNSAKFKEISDELDSIIKLNTALDERNTKLLQTREVFESLITTVNNQQASINPILREYLKDIIDIRMSFGREVKNILEHVRQLNEIAKSNKQLQEFAETLDKFNKVLDPEMLVKIGVIFNVSSLHLPNDKGE